MLALNPAVKENLAKWQASSLARRKHGRAIYTRCRRFLLWMHAHNEAKLTSWQDVRPVLVDNFIKERLEPPAGSGFRPVSPGTVARDVAAVPAAGHTGAMTAHEIGAIAFCLLALALAGWGLLDLRRDARSAGARNAAAGYGRSWERRT